MKNSDRREKDENPKKKRKYRSYGERLRETLKIEYK